jgi:hypothetical protein
VTQEFLDSPQVHAGLQEVRCERVPQGMGVKIVPVRALADGRIQDSPNRSICQSSAALIEEKSCGGLN